MRIREALLLALDTETTSTDVEEARIVQLGGAYVAPGRRTERLSVLVNPGVYIPPRAVQVHGIIDDMVKDAPPWAEVAPRLKARLEDPARRPLACGYNFLAYDLPVIEAENRRAGLQWKFPPVIDAKVWVDWAHRDFKPRTLGAVCAHYGVELAESEAHSADADALATGQLVLAMVEAGVIPDDVEQALTRQEELRRKVEAEFAEFSFHLYRDRAPGTTRLIIGFGQHIGTPLDDADESFRRWMFGRPELTEAAREAVRVSLGVVEQMGLF